MKAKHSLIRKILITSTVPSVVFPFINYVTENKETKKISNKISAPAIISLSDVILPSYTNLGSFESLPTADTILATLNSQSDSWSTKGNWFPNQVQITGITSSSAVVTPISDSQIYSGNVSLTFSINSSLVDLSSVLTNIQLSTDDDNPFVNTPSKIEILSRIKEKNPSVNLNQIDVDLNTIYWDQTRIFDSASNYRGSYKVNIKAKNGSNVYSQSSLVSTFYIQQRTDLSSLIPKSVTLGRFASSNDRFNALQQNNIDPTLITNFNATTNRNNTTSTISIVSLASPYYYGEIIMNFTYDSTGFTKTWQELNQTEGWEGWTSGTMIFYLVDPNNNYVEFMDNNFNSNKNPGLNGNNIKIGSTIVNNGTTYTIIGSAYGNGDCGGLGSSQVNSTLSGQLTIPSTMLYISRNFIRGQKNITQLIIPADSQLESIGECSLMGCTGIQTLDIPASVTTIFYGFFSQYNSDVASTTTHIYFRSPKMIYARDIQSENYYIFYSPGSTAYTDHFIKGTKGTKDGILYVPANLVDTYRTNSDWIAMIADVNMIQPIPSD